MLKTVILVCMLASDVECNIHTAHHRLDGDVVPTPTACMMDAQFKAAQAENWIDGRTEMVKVVCMPLKR